MTPQIPPLDFLPLGPAIAVILTGLAVLLLGLFTRNSAALAALSLVGVAAGLVLSLSLWIPPRPAFLGMIVADSLAAFFTTVILIIAALVILLSANFVVRERFSAGEFYALMLFSTSGMIVLSAATDLIVFIIALEILSIALYVLAGFARERATAMEAAMKYFLLGAFALGFLVYGSALVYGATASTNFAEIGQAIAAGTFDTPLLLIGVGLLLVGFAFKLSLVPFHMWTPDVYQGAPTAVTGFMAVGTKAAVFGALVRVLTEAFPAVRTEWAAVLWALAILTMILGNVAALIQSDLKRMLAYSSIAQAGYILVAVVALSGVTTVALNAIMFYVLAYAFMTLGAFAVLVAVSGPGDERTDLAAFGGLSSRSPLLALAMAIFMLSLAGVPPTAGFMAKLQVFTAAVQAGYVGLAVVGVITSAVAAYYYLRVLVVMYMRQPEAAAATPVAEGAPMPTPAPALAPVFVPAPLIALVIIAVLATFQLGLFPVLPGNFVVGGLALLSP